MPLSPDHLFTDHIKQNKLMEIHSKCWSVFRNLPSVSPCVSLITLSSRAQISTAKLRRSDLRIWVELGLKVSLKTMLATCVTGIQYSIAYPTTQSVQTKIASPILTTTLGLISSRSRLESGHSQTPRRSCFGSSL